MRGGRHAVRAVSRRKMPIAAFGVLAATVVGLGALTAADIQSMDELGGHRQAPFGSHQSGHQHFPRHDPGPQVPGQGPFDQQLPRLPNWMPPGDP